MQVRLIVPNRENAGNGQTFDVLPIEDYGEYITDIAGGFTASQAIGGWVDDKGILIQEPVTVFDIDLSDNPDTTGQCLLRNLARHIAVELKQDCVYLRIDGKVELIGKDESHVETIGDRIQAEDDRLHKAGARDGETHA